MKHLSFFDPEMDVFLAASIHESVSYEEYAINKCSSMEESYVVIADHIADGGHIFDEADYNEYMEDFKEIYPEGEEGPTFTGKALVIFGSD